jgi:hypothetical protein
VLLVLAGRTPELLDSVRGEVRAQYGTDCLAVPTDVEMMTGEDYTDLVPSSY